MVCGSGDIGKTVLKWLVFLLAAMYAVSAVRNVNETELQKTVYQHSLNRLKEKSRESSQRLLTELHKELSKEEVRMPVPAAFPLALADSLTCAPCQCGIAATVGARASGQEGDPVPAQQAY
jgi:hypothetical protein